MLLVAPTGGGKTLAGFLPSLIELAALPARRPRELHTIYISPLKALAVDVARNLETPVAEMGLPVRRRRDAHRRHARFAPPAPEDAAARYPAHRRPSGSRSSSPRARRRACSSILRAVVLDELHAMNNTKRGDLLALGLGAAAQQRRTIASAVGLSATVCSIRSR